MRVSYRALTCRFTLDDEYLEDLKAEIIDAKQLARRCTLPWNRCRCWNVPWKTTRVTAFI